MYCFSNKCMKTSICFTSMVFQFENRYNFLLKQVQLIAKTGITCFHTLYENMYLISVKNYTNKL